MTWNMDKIREECLRLMGWRRETSQNFLDGKTDVIWINKDGIERYEGLPHPDPLPDPTRSLDDALPLMEKYRLTLRWTPPNEYGWAVEPYAGTDFEHAEYAPLAVCLCSLRCAGFNLKDFEQ